MQKGKNSSSIFIIGIVVVTGVVAVFIYANRKDQMDADPEDPNGAAPQSAALDQTGSGPKTDAPVKPASGAAASPKTDPSLVEKVKDRAQELATPKPRLQDIISAAKTWMPCDVHQEWIGKPAPDFTVQDLGGKQHSLSSYRGKNVVIALWAPSFTPSLRELTNLAHLQDAIGPGQLAVLAVSFSDEGAVRRYAESQPAITYPLVAGARQNIPAPYSQGKPLPCAMFVDPDGTLKLSTRGTLSPEDIRSILSAR